MIKFSVFFSCKSLSILLGCLLITTANADNDDGISDCLPQIADRCFKETYDKLPCLLKQEIYLDYCPTNTVIQNNEFKEFCSALDDSLECSSDIIDGSCSMKSGREVFDIWLDGLKAVSSFLCLNVNNTLKVMAEHARCWNTTSFLDCVKETIRIRHVVDVMHAPMDLKECITVVFGLAECNLLATEVPKQGLCSLQIPKELIKELLLIFLSKTNCNSFNYVASSAVKFNSSSNLKLVLSCLLLIFSLHTFQKISMVFFKFDHC